MAVTGREESAANSSADGATPRDTSSAPSAATIAPLSVHSPGRGTRRTMPAAAHRSAASARSRELAATPPPITRWSTPLSRQAATAFFVSTSATASWNEAATSATGTGSSAASRASTHLATAVFRPEKEKSLVPSAYLPRGKAIDARSPAPAARSMCGPPGNGSPSTRATLSNASPAASSMVAPSGTTSAARSATSNSDECPPETSSATAGSGSGPCSSSSTATCAARWLTPYTGLPAASAYALAAQTPTRSAPARPGRDSDRVDVGEPKAGRRERPVHRRHHRFEVRPAGHLGHDSPEPSVLIDAGGNGVSEQLTAAHEPDARLVAGRLDAENERSRHTIPPAGGNGPLTPGLVAAVVSSGAAGAWPVRSRRITIASMPDG